MSDSTVILLLTAIAIFGVLSAVLIEGRMKP